MRKGIKPPIILNKIFQALDNNVAVLKIVFYNTNKFILSKVAISPKDVTNSGKRSKELFIVIAVANLCIFALSFLRWYY